jgi:PAS domain S-box-containing protein
MKTTYEDVSVLRSQLLNATLLVSAIVGIPSLGISLSRTIFMGWKPVMAVQMMALLMLWLLWLGRKRIPYSARAISLMLIFWVITYSGLWQFGLIASSKLFAPLNTLLCVFLFEFPLAGWLIATNILSMALLGFAATRHWVNFDVDYQVYAYNPLPWLHVTWNLFSFNTIIAFLSWQMLTRLKSNAEQARANADYLQKVTANAPGVIYQYLLRADGSSCLPYASSKLYDLLGVGPEQVLDDAGPLFAVMHGDDLPAIKHLIAQCARQCDVFRAEFRVLHPEYGCRWIGCHATPERVENGDTLWHGFFTDISRQKANEAELEENKALFQRLFGLLPMPLAVVNRHGRIVELNSRFIQTFGYVNAEVVTLDDWWPLAFPEPAYRQQAMTAWNDALHKARDHGSDIQGLEYRITDKRGKIRTMVVSGITLDDGFLATFFDITARKETEQTLQASESRFRQLVENSPVAYLCLDISGYILDTNDKFCQMAGYPREQLLHRNFNRICDPDCHVEFIDHFIDGQQMGILPVAEELRLLRGDGGAIIVLVEWRVQLDVEGQFVQCHCVLYDISERKNMENALLDAKMAAESANAAKSMFLASMSHELRTPLNVIIGFAELLNIGAPEPLLEAQKPPVAHILKAGRQLLTLVDDVLDLARIESGKLELRMEPVSLDSMLDEMPTTFKRQAAERHIELTVDNAVGLSVLADAFRLRQILQNLVSNAIKYNREHGRVTIVCQKTEDSVRICVEDTGMGIAEHLQSELFQPFRRLGMETTHIEGTGIGLVLCRYLIEAMHGSMGFKSDAGVGSQFWLELPGVMPAPPALPARADDNQDLSLEGRVLYIEDNPVHVSLIEHLFRRIPKVRLYIAQSASEGLAMLKDVSPDLVLMDISLPGMSGLEALKVLKADPLTAQIPVVAVSAAAMVDDIKQGLDAGFLAYLTKPLDITQLLDMIAKVLTK